ncbi:MAG: DUF5005 domain-containing protein [Bryobacteraceae bacterium]
MPDLLLRYVFVLLAAMAALDAQCTLPAAPGPAAPDNTFDNYFIQNGPGWTGADGTYSVPLPDGQNLWVWSDSYIGTVNPATRLRSGWLFQAHNSLTILDQATGALTTVGYPPKTSSYFAPANSADWFWPGDSMVIQPKPSVYTIKVMLLEWTGVFQFVGNSVATVAYPSMKIESIAPIALPDLTIEWGTRIFKQGNYFYLYGIMDPGTANKLPFVARFTTLGDLTNPAEWQYWNSTSHTWVAGQSNATPMAGVPAITNEYSVDRLNATTGPFYLMTGMDTQNPAYPDWEYVTTYYSCTPQGPWTARTVVYTTPESGAPGCSVGTLYTYNPKAHPEFPSSAGILVSYNVNANNSKDLVCANDYKPSFIRVPIPGLQLTAAP